MALNYPTVPGGSMYPKERVGGEGDVDQSRQEWAAWRRWCPCPLCQSTAGSREGGAREGRGHGACQDVGSPSREPRGVWNGRNLGGEWVWVVVWVAML